MSPAFALLDHLPIHAWDRVLFVECGDGWVAEEAWRRVPRGYVLGVDRSPEQVARARELRGVPEKLDFQTWDGERLPCADHTFDLVICNVALEGDPASEMLRQELHRVARPSGRIHMVESAAAMSRG